MRPGRLAAALLLALVASPARAEEPAPPPPPSPPPADEDLAQTVRKLAARVERLSQELEAQRALAEASSAATTTSSTPASLQLYGFADMGFQKIWASADSPSLFVLPSTASTFVMGNLNLYLDAQAFETFGLLAEIRFTNYPNGADSAALPGDTYKRTSTSTFDVTSASGGWSQVKWGGTVIERAYLQWHKWDWLGVRVGAFLTPFGIWNIDHGTPTLISLMLPMFEVTELFPTHQVGLQLFGTTRQAGWELGYFAYVTNGRTPGEVSLTEDKLVGGRLFARRSGATRLTLGASGLWGHYADTSRQVTSLDPLSTRTTVGVAYREWVAGVDVALDAGRLRLRSEAVFRSVAYDEGHRAPPYAQPGVFNITNTSFARGFTGVYAPDTNQWDAYLLVAYQLPWLGIEPFAYAEFYRWPTPVGDGIWVASAGLNVHLGSSALIKLQYAFDHAFADVDKPFESQNSPEIHLLATRLVLAF